jgi:hypothetical protein
VTEAGLHTCAVCAEIAACEPTELDGRVYQVCPRCNYVEVPAPDDSPRCPVCQRLLQARNRTGYCQDHRPVGPHAYGTCADCGVQLGRRNHSGLCAGCAGREASIRAAHRRGARRLATANHFP